MWERGRRGCDSDGWMEWNGMAGFKEVDSRFINYLIWQFDATKRCLIVGPTTLADNFATAG